MPKREGIKLGEQIHIMPARYRYAYVLCSGTVRDPLTVQFSEDSFIFTLIFMPGFLANEITNSYLFVSPEGI